MILVTQKLQGRNKYVPLVAVLCALCILPAKQIFKSKSLGDLSTRIDNDIECELFSQGLSQFSSALKEDPEENGLRVWTLDGRPRFPLWQFPGFTSHLMRHAFRGKRVTLLGDSTLHYMMRWIHAVFNTTDTEMDQFQKMNLSQANDILNPEGHQWVGLSLEDSAEVRLVDGTHIRWLGYRGSDVGTEVCEFENIWREILNEGPDILVANFGLHWLHLIGGGREIQPCYISWWLDYEKWLDQVIETAEKAGTQLVLFKTTNLLCSDKYEGEYYLGAQDYDRHEKSALDECYKTIRNMAMPDDFVLSDESIATYCEKAALVDHSVMNLNHRLVEYVHKLNTKRSPQQSHLTVAIYNDHDIQSCKFTEQGDGRHYHPLNLMRIRLLSNMIQCLYPR